MLDFASTQHSAEQLVRGVGQDLLVAGGVAHDIIYDTDVLRSCLAPCSRCYLNN